MKTPIEFRRIRQPMDGNCFFHSVSYLLNYYKIYDLSHLDLRQIVAKYYIKRLKEDKANHILISGTWAETEDVIATSNALRISIRVWEGRNKMWITFGNYKKKIYLHNKDNCHFDSLIRLN